jgi:hypothetical protein
LPGVKLSIESKNTKPNMNLSRPLADLHIKHAQHTIEKGATSVCSPSQFKPAVDPYFPMRDVEIFAK